MNTSGAIQAVRIASNILKETQLPNIEIIQVNLAAANPNLSPGIRFGEFVFVADQTGRHPISGEVGRDVREQPRYAMKRIEMILQTAATSR